MGKLSNIRHQMEAPKPIAIEGMLEAIAQNVAKTVAASMSEDMTRQVQGLNVMQGQVDRVAPAVEAALLPALRESFSDLERSLSALRREMKKQGSTARDAVSLQGAMVKALDRIRIPDYTAQIASLKTDPVDLAPVLKKIDSIEFPEAEERPDSWTFEIERDQNGLIKRVKAEAE